MARLAHTILFMVILALLYLFDKQHTQAASLLSTQNEENHDIEVTMNTSPLQTLKRSPRSKMVVEIVIDLGKNKKQKKKKGN